MRLPLFLVFYIFMAFLIGSCGRNSPRIVYEEDTIDEEETSDTTRIKVAELPVFFDSTDVLLHPVGWTVLEESRGLKLRSGSYSGADFVNSYSFGDEVEGDFNNVIFEKRDGRKTQLTDKKVTITSVTFLREFFYSTKRKYLLYKVRDKDTNNDNSLDLRDLESLYISTLEGTGFEKLSPEMHDFYEGKLISSFNRYYFSTQEDINKDGRFTKHDRLHYFYIAFDSSGYKVERYDPLAPIK